MSGIERHCFSMGGRVDLRCHKGQRSDERGRTSAHVSEGPAGNGGRAASSTNGYEGESLSLCGPPGSIEDLPSGTAANIPNSTRACALIQGCNGVPNGNYSELEPATGDASLSTLV
jgi:hypothetical protein